MVGLRLFLYKTTCVGYIQLFSIVGWFTLFTKEFATLEEVNHYEEYVGPLD